MNLVAFVAVLLIGISILVAILVNRRTFRRINVRLVVAKLFCFGFHASK